MLLDILLLLLILAAFGGFGWNAGWWRPPGTGYVPPGTVAPGTAPPTSPYPVWNPIGIVLVVVIVLLLLVLLSPWPFHHSYYRW